MFFFGYHMSPLVLLIFAFGESIIFAFVRTDLRLRGHYPAIA